MLQIYMVIVSSIFIHSLIFMTNQLTDLWQKWTCWINRECYKNNKKRAGCMCHAVPYKCYTKLMIQCLVEEVIEFLNFFFFLKKKKHHKISRFFYKKKSCDFINLLLAKRCPWCLNKCKQRSCFKDLLVISAILLYTSFIYFNLSSTDLCSLT